MNNFRKHQILSVVVLSILAISGINYINVQLTGDKIENNNGIIIAHRGGAGLAPENTISAIKNALGMKIPGIEIDVKMTKDSVVIVFHDKTINRTTNGSGKVTEMTFSELREYSAGLWYDREFEQEKIPSLDEILNLVNGRSKLFIDVKSDSKNTNGIERKIVDLVDRFNAKSWCVILSLDDETLNNFYSLDSTLVLYKSIICDIPLIPILIDSGINWGELTDYKNVNAFSFYNNFVTKKLVSNLHKSGYQVYVWTVNDSTEIEEFFEIGVDGVFTNYPDYNRK